MRWQNLQLDHGLAGDPMGSGRGQPHGAIPLLERSAVVRRFDTPHFRGMTFYEIRARSIINRVPEASRMPFRWTINPYRGCSHACRYCFARNTHTYLDLNAGHDFDTKIVVKVNAADLLGRELAHPRWAGEHIAMGTNVDCYQRAEGKYRLMRGILAALRDRGNPFSVLTKGSLILCDLDLLEQAAAATDVAANVSVAFVDEQLWRRLEPGTPAPAKRLAVCRTLNEHGIRCGVLMAPILPYLTDRPEQLDRAVRATAEAGAVHVSPVVLHLRPGAREWFMAWLARDHPGLVVAYEALYGRRAYAPRDYQDRISGTVRELAAGYGIGSRNPGATRRVPPAPDGSASAAGRQLDLF